MEFEKLRSALESYEYRTTVTAPRKCLKCGRIVKAGVDLYFASPRGMLTCICAKCHERVQNERAARADV